MITAIDTSVLIDIFSGNARFGQASTARFREALAQGSVVACEIVWAEVAGLFPRPESAQDAMAELAVEFSGMTSESAMAAGAAWRQYRQRGGERARMLADFLIGAHAQSQTDRLLTRDRGFYRTYFRGLTVIEPVAT